MLPRELAARRHLDKGRLSRPPQLVNAQLPTLSPGSTSLLGSSAGLIAVGRNHFTDGAFLLEAAGSARGVHVD